MNRNAIRAVYGARGPEVEKALYDNPLALIPVIIPRLRQKEMEWSLSKLQWGSRWRRMYDEYFLRSLDHESVNFKADQKHRLSPNDIVEELKGKMTRRLKQAPNSGKH